MALSKQDLVNALSYRLGAVPFKASMTAAGDSTSVISTALIGFGNDHFNGWYILITSGAESVKWRLVTDYDSPTGDFTVAPALAGAPGGASETFEVHAYNPSLYTLALNEAMVSAYEAVYYPLRNWGGVIGYSGRNEYSVPREFDKVLRVQRELSPSRKYFDTFDRADSATSPGTPDSTALAYTEQVGNGGISSNEFYFPDDNDGDMVLVDLDYDTDKQILDGYFQATIRGTLAHNTVFRTIALIFRYLDSNNYLLVRLRSATTAASGGQVDLHKVDGGVESSLATGSLTTSNGVDYVLRVQYVGARIAAWVDEVELMQYELLGTDYVKYSMPSDTGVDATIPAPDRIGFRLDKGGAPGTAARLDDAKYHKWVNTTPITDWEMSPDKRWIQFKAISYTDPGLWNNRPLIIEGIRRLTLLTEDTTTGTLDTYATDRVELTENTKEWSMVLDYAVAHMYERLANPVVTRNEKDRAEFRALAQAAWAKARAARELAHMPTVPKPIRGP